MLRSLVGSEMCIRDRGKAYDKKYGIERESLGDNPNSRPNVDVDNQTHDYGMTGKVNQVTRGNGPFEGWGTALKPSHEPMVLARKPISEKTILANAEKWGTGGINIAASRVGDEMVHNDRFKPDVSTRLAGIAGDTAAQLSKDCLLYTSPSPRDS